MPLNPSFSNQARGSPPKSSLEDSIIHATLGRGTFVIIPRSIPRLMIALLFATFSTLYLLTYTFIPRKAFTNKTVAIAMAREPTATWPQMVKSQALSGW